MPPKTIDIFSVRSKLENLNSMKSNKILFYPASGTDLACSLGIFFDVCDEFHLVDPSFTNELWIVETIKKITERKIPSISNRISRVEEIKTENQYRGLSCRTYSIIYDEVFIVNKKASVYKTKKLILISCGTSSYVEKIEKDEFLNVILCKDYDSIEGSQDENFPYAKLWSHLYIHGYFAETIGTNSSSLEYEFSFYRRCGLEPIYQVLNNNEKIGFAQGFFIFQKLTFESVYIYEKLLAAKDNILKYLINHFLKFILAYDSEYGKIDDTPEDDRLFQNFDALIAQIRPEGINRWNDIKKSNKFINWFHSSIQKELAFDSFLLFGVTLKTEFPDKDRLTKDILFGGRHTQSFSYAEIPKKLNKSDFFN